MTTTYNKVSIANWKRFEKVRAGGKYSMFDPRARRLTGLDLDSYAFVMKNYSELRTAAEEQK